MNSIVDYSSINKVVKPFDEDDEFEELDEDEEEEDDINDSEVINSQMGEIEES